MSYTLKFSDTTKANVIVPAMPPGINAVDTSLSLVGRGYPNYGEKIAENFLHLLENFANQIPPENPVEGQLWYDTSNPDNKVLRVMNGTAASTSWSSISGIYQQTTDPKLVTTQGLKNGDIWVDTFSNQLKIYGSGNWTLVGPQTTSNLTGVVPEYISDNLNPPGYHWVIKNYVNYNVVSVISGDTFIPNPSIPGFDPNKPLIAGINLATGSILNGISSSTYNLSINNAIYPASSFLRKDNSGGEIITGKVRFVGSYGVTISSNFGDNTPIQFYKNANDAFISNTTPGGKIVFTTAGTSLLNSVYIEGGNLHVGKTLYVNTFNLNTATLVLASTAVSASTTTGALIVSGGVGIGGRLNIGNTATIYSIAASTSTTTGALIVSGGVGIGGSLNVGGNLDVKELSRFRNTVIADRPIFAYGNIVSAGTSSYVQAPYMLVGKSIEVFGTATSISTTTGALLVAGGVGIGGAVNIGQTSTIAGARILTTATSAIVYPEDFGAVGNGSTNDYGALQAAINTGKSVYLSDGKTYYYTTGLILNNSFQRFGGPGVLKPSGSINGVTIGGGSEGVEVDLTFNAPNLAGCAVRIDNANRVTIKKLHGLNIGIGNASSSILYVQKSNTCVVEWMWAVTGGKGITWYGSDSLRSDILRINFAVLDCADDQYGLDWDGNCHSLEIGYLGLVGTKGAIIRNTYKDSNPGATTFPAIGRLNHIEIDYPTSHGIEITAGLDYDINIPYILGAGFSISSPGKSGIKIGPAINSYQVRINGGKSIGNTGYGIENSGGVVYFDGTTDLSNNTLGRTTGPVWTTVERLTLDDDYFYLTMSGGNPLIVFGDNSAWVYDRVNKQLNLTVDAGSSLQITKTYVQTLKPLITPVYTVATLPSGLRGMRVFVTDASTSTFYNDVVAGSPGYYVPVFFNGNSWKIG